MVSPDQVVVALDAISFHSYQALPKAISKHRRSTVWHRFHLQVHGSGSRPFLPGKAALRLRVGDSVMRSCARG